MRFNVKNNSRENTGELMRQMGYRLGYLQPSNDESSFVRLISGVPYPRFHIYLKENKQTNELFFNLHLDQKKPSYGKQTAHSGEYDTGLIDQEVERIKQYIQNVK